VTIDRHARVAGNRGVARLIERLNAVKPTGEGRWIACCPAHDDRHPSLSIRELRDGRVLVHCFAGCAVHDVVRAVDLTLEDLMPAGAVDPERRDRRAFRERPMITAADALRVAQFESIVVATLASALARGEPLEDAARDRLWQACARISEAARLAGLEP